MAGTRAGGLKAAATNKKKYGKDFYRINGAIGGRISYTGGFYGDSERARELGRIGGAISRRGSKAESDKRTAKIAKLYSKGNSYSKIANKLGISVTTVAYHIRKARYES